MELSNPQSSEGRISGVYFTVDQNSSPNQLKISLNINGTDENVCRNEYNSFEYDNNEDNCTDIHPL